MDARRPSNRRRQASFYQIILVALVNRYMEASIYIHLKLEEKETRLGKDSVTVTTVWTSIFHFEKINIYYFRIFFEENVRNRNIDVANHFLLGN